MLFAFFIYFSDLICCDRMVDKAKNEANQVDRECLSCWGVTWERAPLMTSPWLGWAPS